MMSSRHGSLDEEGGRKGEREKVKEKREEEEEIYCGLGQCRPSFLQRCANIKCVTAALCFAGLSTSTLSIYINSQITTLEKQFGFSSSISGILLSCNDFGYLLTTLFMAYLARRVHILRVLSLSTFLFGVSGLLCTVPFFASLADLPPVADVLPGSGYGNADVISGGNASEMMMSKAENPFEKYLCVDPARDSSSSGGVLEFGGNGSVFSDEKGDACERSEQHRSSAMSGDQKWMAVAFIAVGMIFQGFGKSPRYPFIGTYIDDNVPKTKTTLYLGIVSCFSIFGPVLAFTLGGLFSKMYLTLEDTTMTPRDPRWVGAWWLGFLLFGFMGILAAIPTLFLPRRLRPQPHLRQLEKDRKRAAKGHKYSHDLKVYACLVLATCSTLFGVSGTIAFQPKYLETQFMIPAWKANIILGILNILSAAGGTLIGGIVTSRFKLSPRTCLKMIVITTVVSAIVITCGFFLGCDQPEISMGASAGTPSSLQTQEVMTCRPHCQCDDTLFFPTCGADDVTYFSPCHAGCSESQGMSFHSCSCVNTTMTSSSEMTSPPGEEKISEQEATPGFGSPNCGMLYPYAALNFFGAFSSTLVIMPSFIVSVRSVSEWDKPLAIGLSAFMASLLGWFLGPIVFGKIVDTCCLIWSSGCDSSGSCSLYDIVAFRNRYHAAFLSSRLLAFLFYFVALAIAVVKKVRFTPHGDNDVMTSTLPVEEEAMMLEKSGNAGKAMGGNEEEDDEIWVLGGEKIYKGNNNVL